MGNDEKLYSPEEIIDFTINILNGIDVPVALHDQIATPILQALSNLHAARESLRDRDAAAAAEPDGDEPAIREEEL